MKKIPLHEAKVHFSKYVEKVSQGQVFVITKHGQPIAELKKYTPVSEERNKRAILAIKKISLSQSSMSDEKLKAMICEGRS